MAQLAIRGHTARGKEVIELLEMLGGKNCEHLTGGSYIGFYYIDDDECIKNRIYAHHDANTKLFDIEEFLEKFPYKVGDKVSVYEYESKVRIDDMKWDGFEIQYSVLTDETEWYSAAELNELNKCNKPYKEETMEERENSIVVNHEHKQLKVHSLRYDKVKLMINDEYKLIQEDDGYYIVRNKPKYPKSYKECCDALGLCTMDNDAKGYKSMLIIRFQELLIARDAYWKIAGDWKPDWRNNQFKYIIVCGGDNIINDTCITKNCILAFPTAEIRDAFYENFKELIEQCKELI